VYKHDVRESKLQNFFSKNKDTYLDDWWQKRMDAIKKAEDDAAEAARLVAEAAAAKGKKPDKKEEPSPRKDKSKDSAKGKKSKSSGVEDNALSGNENEGLSEPEVNQESQIMHIEKVEEIFEIPKRPTNKLERIEHDFAQSLHNLS